MREIAGKQNWALYTLLMVLIIICIGYFGINPFINEFKSLNIEIQQKNVENTQLENKLTALKQLKDEFNQNKDEITRLSLALPKTNMAAEITETLRKITSDTGMTITGIKQTTDNKETGNTKIDLSFESSYKSFKLFLSDIQENVRYAVPTKITLTQTKTADGSEPYIKGTISFDFFKTNEKSTNSTQTTNTQTSEVSQ